ncbi:hypothetical protein [Sphingobacterium sp. FBM7-1]|uniref:hypothetical protein n=1 Tax=Sphingobacterium sp. FBM7-1 TaxID=2886688 RepID=UPI001D10A8BC|nr:hypothetical protein [Sphingobacterium sp. FBM7-1]MCC2599178.1 hypothetical protein [Sphingobacterium sp. FBM7-1]
MVKKVIFWWTSLSKNQYRNQVSFMTTATFKMLHFGWILRFDLCQSFRSDGASYYGSNDATPG